MTAEAPRSTGPTNRLGIVVLGLFFLSGVAALTYEVVWARLLRHVMGNDIFSMSTVVCAFMAGLALGSVLIGRWIDRRDDPFRVYGLIEIAIGLYCLALPHLIDAAQPLFGALYRSFEYALESDGPAGARQIFVLARFGIAFIILLPPSTLMGATLPVLARFCVQSPGDLGRRAGRLYAVNTFGAAVGAAAAGFLLLPRLGISVTLYVACAVNITIGLAALVLDRANRQPTAAPASKSEAARAELGGSGTDRAARSLNTVFLIGYGLSGLAALVYEIAWTRSIALLIGSSAYAFSLLLTAYIVGLALGSAVSSRFADRVRDPVRAFALLQVAIGAAATLATPFIDQLSHFASEIIVRLGPSFWGLQAAEFGLILAIMIVPTALMGAAFPLAARIYGQARGSVGASVGVVYGANTVGSIIGAFVGGFVLLPAIGVQSTILLAAWLNVIVGCALLDWSPRLRGIRRGMSIAAILTGFAAIYSLVPTWDRSRLTTGSFMSAQRPDSYSDSKPADGLRRANEGRLVYYKDGAGGTVTVRDYGGQLSLFVNGKADASTSSDLATQQLLAHVPLLVHPRPRSACVIGLASGITLGSASLHPLDTLDCLEVSPEVAEACRLFDRANHGVLDDPRVRLIIADGRNHLALSGRKYDVIISEPSNPWMAGLGDLFTRDFYEVCRGALNSGGVMCSWLNSYDLDVDTFKSVVRSFREAFPYTTIWEPSASDYLLIGSDRELSIDYDRLVERLGDVRLRADLARITIDGADRLLAHFLMENESVARFCESARLNTDDNGLLEYAAARTFYQPDLGSKMLAVFEPYRGRDVPPIALVAGSALHYDELRVRIRNIGRAHGVVQSAVRLSGADNFERAVSLLREAIRLDPDSAEAHFQMGLLLAGRNRAAEALEHLTRADQLAPGARVFNRAAVQVRLARAYERSGDFKKAAESYQRAIRLLPYNVDCLVSLAGALLKLTRSVEAETVVRRAMELRPDDVDLRYHLGNALAQQKKLESAAAEFRIVLREHPDHALAHGNLGAVLHARGKADEALIHYREALRLAADARSAYPTQTNIGVVLAGRGELDEAVSQFRGALRVQPTYVPALRALADTLVKLERNEEAIGVFREIIAEEPRDLNAHCALGDLLLGSGRRGGAIEAYRAAQAIEPGNPKAAARLREAESMGTGDGP